MGDRLRTGKRPQYATSHPGQLSLLPYAVREMSRHTGQSAVMLGGSGVKAGMAHSICGQTCGWQVKRCYAWLTCASLSAEYRTHYKVLYNVPFTLL